MFSVERFLEIQSLLNVFGELVLPLIHIVVIKRRRVRDRRGKVRGCSCVLGASTPLAS